MEPIVELAREHPVAVGAVSGYLLLKLFARYGGKKPGTWSKPAATDAAEYPALKRGEHYWTTDHKAEMKIKVASSGVASIEPTTLSRLFDDAVANFGDFVALKVERGGGWKSWTWAE